MSDRRYRRTVLASLGTAAATALAGCNSTSNDTNDPESGTQTSTPTRSPSGDVFESVTHTTSGDSAVLEVTVSEDADASTVALHNDNGEEIRQQELGTGTTANLDLNGLASSSYQVVAAADNDVLGKQAVELGRSIEVEDVNILTEDAAETFAVGVANTGDLPVRIIELIGYGDVPDPVNPDDPDFRLPYVQRENGDIERTIREDGYTCLPGETVNLVLNGGSGSVLDVQYKDEACTGEQRTATIRLQTERGEKRVLDATYSLSGERQEFYTMTACGEWTLHDWNVVES